jgi:hypothetical protein
MAKAIREETDILGLVVRNLVVRANNEEALLPVLDDSALLDEPASAERALALLCNSDERQAGTVS